MIYDQLSLKFDRDSTNGDFTTLFCKLDNGTCTFMWIDGNGVQLGPIFEWYMHNFSLTIDNTLIVIGVDEL